MYNSILDILIQASKQHPQRVTHKSRKGKKQVSHTMSEFHNLVEALCLGFKDLGIKAKDHVGFFVNNRYEWIATDFALMALGAVSIPRGSDTTPKEVEFIFNHSDSSFLILENFKQLKELQDVFTIDRWKKCKKILIIDSLDKSLEEEFVSITNLDFIKEKIYFYKEIIVNGEAKKEQEADDFLESLERQIKADDLLTIVYTSGTTGNPKGVMLSHGNFLQNVVANTPRLQVDPSKEEKTVVMLPTWHVYERAFEYCAISCALTLIYSSPGRFALDLQKEKPEILITVPRIWESIYQKIIRAISEMPFLKRRLVLLFIKVNQVYLTAKNYVKGHYICLKKRPILSRVGYQLFQLLVLVLMFPGHLLAHLLFKPFREKVGGKLRGATSAAGSLPKYLDDLFNAIGITIVNAYGMTECAPGIVSRTFDQNTFGSTGIPFDNTEVEIRLENGEIAKIGQKGILYAKGPQVMKGYYKNPSATAAVLSPDGWLNTGDLAVQSENGEYIIVGRMKDTIVLMGGENVEPEPIEDKMKESSLIDHAILLGQDQKQLSAVIAVNEENLMKLAQELKLSPTDVILEGKDSIEHDRVYDLLMKEVRRLISKEQGFKPFEAVTKILPVINDFSIGKELTQTLKVKRKYIEDKYKSMISKLWEDTEKRKKK